ncbi:MAG: cohesin domain-containing protein [Candidatus Nealsonbacteria bacterium]
MKKIILLICLLLSFLAVSQAKAQTASIYLSPASGSFLVGSVFTVSILVNTEGNEINTIWAELKFPSNQLQITSPTAGTSFVSEWLSPPTYSNEQGVITFKGGIQGGIKTSAGVLAQITFRAISAGTARIEFTGSSQILLNDGLGTNVLTDIRSGKYQILVPPPEGPRVVSVTHPNENVWYSDESPSFAWEEETGVSEYSWSFDQNPSKRPDTVSEGSETQISFSQIRDGVWYFHLRQKKSGVWEQTSNIQVKIDSTEPREFTTQVKNYAQGVGYQAVVYFETTDDFSGIDHYQVSVVDLNEKGAPRSFFTEAVSPYKIPLDKGGKYNIIIRAVDRAGNYRESESRFRIISSIITHIEGRGIEIKGVLVNWWLIWLFVLLLPVLAVWWFFFHNKR